MEYWYYAEKLTVLDEYNRKQVDYNVNRNRVEDFHSKYVQQLNNETTDCA